MARTVEEIYEAGFLGFELVYKIRDSREPLGAWDIT
jgi:hypothetical protein